MEATVTIICGMILALGQGWLNLRLRQQDDARDLAREEAKRTGERLRLEAEILAETVARKAETVAAEVATKVDDAAMQTDLQLGQIHLLVNTRLEEALGRVQALETKLGLASGEEIPAPQIVTRGDDD